MEEKKQQREIQRHHVAECMEKEDVICLGKEKIRRLYPFKIYPF